MNLREGWSAFKAHASKKNYKRKIVGDYGFWKGRTNKFITLKAIRGNTLHIHESGVGLFTIEV